MQTIDINLYDFQKQDVDKLVDTPNVLIANEMGSGKTYEAIALDERRRAWARNFCSEQDAKTLVVAPLSVVTSWRDHFNRLTPLTVVTVNPKRRYDSWLKFQVKDADVFIMHWDALRLLPELQKIRWLHIIADECHRAQNRNAKQTKALKKLKADFRTGLSGTPITNTPDKIWSILNWLYPKDYRSYWRFFAEFVDWEPEYTSQGAYKKIKGPKNESRLLEQMGPYYVRHRKRERCCPHHPNGVLPELPDKYYSTMYVDLLPQQEKAYKQMRKEMIAWVGENEDTPLIAPVVIAQLTRLQQFAVAYAEVSSNGVRLAEPSSKIDALMQIIEDNPDEQLVVFSQFKQLINLVNKRLENAKVSFVSLTGDTPNHIRGTLVDRFQMGESKVFTGTIAAGGIGITLTASSTVIFLDRSWSPALNSQAEDRLHRIGQKNAVQVVDILAKNTVDLGRQQKLIEKWDWLRRLLGDE